MIIIKTAIRTKTTKIIIVQIIIMIMLMKRTTSKIGN